VSEILSFTEAQLMDDEQFLLPGWRDPTNLFWLMNRTALYPAWTPVLSVSVFREHPDDPERIQTLTGIRQNTSTHENVVSTLTGVFPPSIQRQLVLEKHQFLIGGYPGGVIGKEGPNPQEAAVLARYRPNLEGVPDTRSLLSYLCHDIFARKLERPDLISLRSEDELGTASLARIALGVSYVGDTPAGDPRYELLMMFGTAFMLHKHQSHAFDPQVHDRMNVMPKEKRRYGSLGWTDNAATFPEDVHRKDVIRLAPYMPEHETVEVCARGQCLRMTSELMLSPDILVHLGRVPLEGFDDEDHFG